MKLLISDSNNIGNTINLKFSPLFTRSLGRVSGTKRITAVWCSRCSRWQSKNQSGKMLGTLIQKTVHPQEAKPVKTHQNYHHQNRGEQPSIPQSSRVRLSEKESGTSSTILTSDGGFKDWTLSIRLAQAAHCLWSMSCEMHRRIPASKSAGSSSTWRAHSTISGLLEKSDGAPLAGKKNSMNDSRCTWCLPRQHNWKIMIASGRVGKDTKTKPNPKRVNICRTGVS